MISAQTLPSAAEVERVAAGESTKFISLGPDLEAGGFFSEFGATWDRLPEKQRAGVYQARMSWTLAELHRRRSESFGDLRPVVDHGLTYLKDRLWDQQNGGFYWSLSVTDAPAVSQPQLKHLYGQSFAIYAAANVFRATGEESALDLACRGYRWVEKHARDPDHPGYFEVLTAEGQPVTVSPYADPKQGDAIGTAFGFKSMNTHLHLMEAYTELYRVWPDEGLRARLAELLGLVRDTMVVPPGAMNMFFTADWRAVPGHNSFGHNVEAAYLMLEAAELLGDEAVAKTMSTARLLVDQALIWGYDTELGGFYDTGGAWGPPHDKTKVWWAQAEALNALMLMDDQFGEETARYRDAFAKTWEFCNRYLIDQERGGWRWSVEADGTPVGTDQKANQWKGPYHSVRAMINIADRLRTREEAAQ